MPLDLQFEEKCPCGNQLKISGYASVVQPQIVIWHKTHNKHSDAFAKALGEKPQPAIPYTWPYGKWPWSQTLTIPDDQSIVITSTNNTKTPS